jgi:hypothetical protein
VEPTYDREAMLRSARHARAQGYVARVKNREHAQAVLSTAAPARM